jgi:hypothetical protein
MPTYRKNYNRKKRNQRNKKQSGGGAGSGWTMGGPLLPGAGTPEIVNQKYDTCMSAARPGQIPFSMSGGIPYGGIMKGGAYTNNLASGIAGFAQIDRDTSHCNPNHVNPMNTGVLKQSGGAAVGVGGGSIAASASPVLEEHTARYTTAPSQWSGSTGTPVLLNQPLNGQMWSKACTQTGGRKRRQRRNKKSRATRRVHRTRKD